MFDTGVTMGLAEWIIDGTCLVLICVQKFFPKKEEGRTLKNSDCLGTFSELFFLSSNF